jgi:hypothetical protein
MTLIELVIAATITSLMSVVLGGLVLAVHTARTHCEGYEEATAQSQAAIDRISYMVSQAGVYRLTGESPVLGVATVAADWGGEDIPHILVVWSGGRSGGMADDGVVTRLPKVNELVIYTGDPADPSRFVELMVPGNSSDIDFADAGFDAAIEALVASPSAELVLLCDRLRALSLGAPSPMDIGGVRFQVEFTPTDDEIAAETPGTAEWNDLRWAQTLVTGESGVRQATVRIEMQVERQRAGDGNEALTAIPFFGSASYRYAYSP